MEPEEEAQDLCPPVRGRKKETEVQAQRAGGAQAGAGRTKGGGKVGVTKGHWRLKEDAVAEGLGRKRGRWAGGGRRVCGYHLSLSDPPLQAPYRRVLAAIDWTMALLSMSKSRALEAQPTTGGGRLLEKR